MITRPLIAAASALVLVYASSCSSQGNSATTACGAEPSASFTGNTSHTGGIHDFTATICPGGHTVYGFYKVAMPLPAIGVRLFRGRSFTKPFAGELSLESMGSVRPVFAINSEPRNCAPYWRGLPKSGKGRKVSIFWGLPADCKELPNSA